MIASKPLETNRVLTGRFATKKLMEAADAVNELVVIKYPRKLIYAKGVQY